MMNEDLPRIMTIHNTLQRLSGAELRSAIRSLQNRVWADDDPLRLLSIRIYGEEEGDDVLFMLNLAIPLAVELERRVDNFLSFDNSDTTIL